VVCKLVLKSQHCSTRVLTVQSERQSRLQTWPVQLHRDRCTHGVKHAAVLQCCSDCHWRHQPSQTMHLTPDTTDHQQPYHTKGHVLERGQRWSSTVLSSSTTCTANLISQRHQLTTALAACITAIQHTLARQKHNRLAQPTHAE
jgi:hypothetical protein